MTDVATELREELDKAARLNPEFGRFLTAYRLAPSREEADYIMDQYCRWHGIDTPTTVHTSRVAQAPDATVTGAAGVPADRTSAIGTNTGGSRTPTLSLLRP